MNLALHLKHSKKGFTLLEVMISMAILTFISYSIYLATTQTFKLRDSLSTEGDFYNSIRLSMSILHRDISLLYSPVMLSPTLQTPPNPSTPIDPKVQQDAAAVGLSQGSRFWSPTTDLTGIRPSHFLGSEDSVAFVSLSHIRIYKNSPESEFAKISYSLKKEDNKDRDTSTFILIKTESTNVFADESVKDTHERSYELLHGIKSLTYTYYQKDGSAWKSFKTWDSDQESTRNRYPDYIEVKITVSGPSRQIFEGVYKFRPEIPFYGLPPTI